MPWARPTRHIEWAMEEDPLPIQFQCRYYADVKM